MSPYASEGAGVFPRFTAAYTPLDVHAKLYEQKVKISKSLHFFYYEDMSAGEN